MRWEVTIPFPFDEMGSDHSNPLMRLKLTIPLEMGSEHPNPLMRLELTTPLPLIWEVTISLPFNAIGGNHPLYL